MILHRPRVLRLSAYECAEQLLVESDDDLGLLHFYLALKEGVFI